MRDTRLYSAAYYVEQLNKYRVQFSEAVEPDEIARLARWIATTEQYIADALKAGL